MLYSTPENNWDVKRGEYLPNFQNNTLKVWPPYETYPIEITFDQESGTVASITRMSTSDAHESQMLGGEGALASPLDATVEDLDEYVIYPARHFVTQKERIAEAADAIEEEMKARERVLRNEEFNPEAADRLKSRVTNDLLLLREVRAYPDARCGRRLCRLFLTTLPLSLSQTGFCSGVENYSRHLAGRAPGVPPETLLDYLKMSGKGPEGTEKKDNDWLLLVDESHVTLPQLKAMYGGDRARKESLVKNGYRLPSAFDNRPLQNSEFWDRVDQALFVSATPGKFERDNSPGGGVDMFIRPTSIVDPSISVRPTRTQLRDLLNEIQDRATRGEKTLAMAITKRDAEDMATYLKEVRANN